MRGNAHFRLAPHTTTSLQSLYVKSRTSAAARKKSSEKNGESSNTHLELIADEPESERPDLENEDDTEAGDSSNAGRETSTY